MLLINKIRGFLQSFFEEKKEIQEDFFSIVFFKFPEKLKNCASNGADIEGWHRDYLSKEKNIQKYIFDACEQLQVFGIGYQKYLRELNQYSSQDLRNKSGQLVARSFEKEARLILRQALELFIESWNFNKLTNKESAIKSYFLIRALQAFYTRNLNSTKYHSLPRQWDQKVITEIRNALKDTDLNLFFLKTEKNPQKDSDVFFLRKSYRELLDESIRDMTHRERMAAGESYQLYAETSEVIHGYSGSPEFKLYDVHKELKSLYARSAILSLHTLKILSGIGREVLQCTEVLDALDKIETGNFEDSIEIKVGDLVKVRGEIKAKVVKVDISDYGCKKYQVEYCDKRGDWAFGFEETVFLRNDLEKIAALRS